MGNVMLPLLPVLLTTDITGTKAWGYGPTVITDVVMGIIIVVLLVDKLWHWVKTKDDNHYNRRSADNRMKNSIKTNEEKIAELETVINDIAIGVQNVLKDQLTKNHKEYMTRKPHPYMTDDEWAIWSSCYEAYQNLGGNSVVERYNRDILNKVDVVYPEDIPYHAPHNNENSNQD